MRIGWASADITPGRPTVLRGQFHVRISEFVNDPITATALALEAGDGHEKKEQAIMVSCDRVSIPDPILQRLREALQPRLPDFDPGKLVLNATHTHTAPEIEEGVYPEQEAGVMTPAEYADLFIERVAGAAEQAWQARETAGVSWAFGHAVVGHNRRITYADGSARMYGDTDCPDFECVEGYEDHGVDLLFTWDTRRNLTGMVINLACPSQVTEGEHYISADFWHEVRGELRQRYGEGLFFLPQCSAAGDQSPHLQLHRRVEEDMRRRKGLSEREEIARRIARAVEDVWEVARQDLHYDAPFLHVVRTLELPARRITEDDYGQASRQADELLRQQPDPADVAAVSRRFVMLNRNRQVMDRYRQQTPPACEVEVHVVRLGDIVFATNPFELFLDFGLRLKARSPAIQTFVVQLAGAGSYLPTARAVAARSYGAEAADNLAGPEGGRMLVERTLEAIQGMWKTD